MKTPDFGEMQELDLIAQDPSGASNRAYAMAYEEIVDGRFDKAFKTKKEALAFLEAQMNGHLPDDIRAKIRREIDREFFLREFI